MNLKSLSRTLLFLFVLFSGATNLYAAVTPDLSQLTFSNQAEGTVSPAQTVTLTNSGTDETLGTLTIGGKDPEQFVVVGDTCSALLLASGQTCTIQVAYHPSLLFPDGVGQVSALLIVPLSAPPSITIPLNGSSSAPEIDSDFSFLNFGTGTVGQLGSQLTVTINNTGEANLLLEDSKIIGANSSDFGLTMDVCSFQTLAPGESCQISLAMRPTDVGVRNATLVIRNNDPDESQFEVQLTGNGKGSGGCSLQPSSHSSGPFNGILVFGFPLIFWIARRRMKTPS